MKLKFIYRRGFAQKNSYRRNGTSSNRCACFIVSAVIACLPNMSQVYAQTPNEEKANASTKPAQADKTGGTPTVLKESGPGTQTIANQPTAVKTKKPDKSGPVENIGKVQQNQDESTTTSPPVSPPTSPTISTIVSSPSVIQDEVTAPVTTLSSNDVGKNDRSNSSASKLESRHLPPDPRKTKKAAQTNATSQQNTNDTAQSLPGVSSLKSINATDWILKTLGALGAVIGLILLAKPLLKRLAGPLGTARAPSGVIEALARYPFGKGQSLVLLKLDSRILLLNQTSQGSNLITELTAPDDVASILRRVHDEKGESFNRKLEEMLHGGVGNNAVNEYQGGVHDGSTASGIVDLTSEGTKKSWWRRIAGSQG